MRSYGPCRVISLPGETVEHLVFESRWTKGKWWKWYACISLHATTCSLISSLLSQNLNERIAELGGILSLITAATAAGTGAGKGQCHQLLLLPWMLSVLQQHHLPLGGSSHEQGPSTEREHPSACCPHCTASSRFQAL